MGRDGNRGEGATVTPLRPATTEDYERGYVVAVCLETAITGLEKLGMAREAELLEGIGSLIAERMLKRLPEVEAEGNDGE